MNVAATSLLRFGVFELDIRTSELRKSGCVVHLPPQPFKILALLAGRPGLLVTREEIQKEIWGSDTFVDFEKGLNFAIKKIREALGDDAGAPRYIETLHRRGYRFVALVEMVGSPNCTSPSSKPSEEPESRQSQLTGTILSAPPQAILSRRTRVLALAGGLLCVAGLTMASLVTLTRPSPRPIKSLAVLPLVNLSGDASQEYFSEGLTDELITDLAKLRGLRVISRTSAMRYKGTAKSLPEIAGELNVDAVVEGSVLLSKNRARIRVQLIEARTDRHLWAEVYERDLHDVLSVQNEVASMIARKINLELTPQQKARLSNVQSADFEAYEAYLKGRYEWNKRTPESLAKSIQYLEGAIKRDPNYAIAHEGLAETYTVLTDYGVLSPGESYPKAKAEALKALALDDGLGEAHATLASVREEYEWDWLGADQEFKRAIELNPNYATAHQWYSEYLLRVRRTDEGLVEMQRALELDPGSPLMNAEMGGALYWAGQYDRSIQQLDKAIEMEPHFAYAHSWLGFAYEQKGMRQKAIEEFHKAVVVSGERPTFTAALGYAYGLSGNKGKARRIVGELKTLFLSKGAYVSPYDIALVYAGLGERDEAMSWLQKAYTLHGSGLDMLREEPALDSLRSDARFTSLQQRVGLCVSDKCDAEK